MNPPKEPAKPAKSSDKDTCAKLFYDRLADTTVRLKGGKILKFNRGALIIHARSNILCELFHGDSGVIDIPDIDHDSFKLFLDCFMGFEPYTFANSLKIFPIASKYEVPNSIDESMKGLALTEISPKICEILNLAVGNQYLNLISQTIGFIQSNSSIYKILEVEEYCNLIEPVTMNALLPGLSIDSHLLRILIKWADTYLKNHPSNGKILKTFLKKYGLSRFFKLDCFETTGAIAEFGLYDIGKGFFTLPEILSHLQNSQNLVHGKSEWKSVQKNVSFIEQLLIPVYLKGYPTEVFNYASIKVERNKVLFYGNKFEKNEKIITCKVTLIGQNESGVTLFELKKESHSSEDNLNHTIYDDGAGSLFKGFSVQGNRFIWCIFNITWTFSADCRVLLMNRQGDAYNDRSTMYFSKDASVIIKNWPVLALGLHAKEVSQKV